MSTNTGMPVVERSHFAGFGSGYSAARNAALLPKDAHVEVLDTITSVGRQGTVLFDDLLSLGLRKDLGPRWWGKTAAEYTARSTGGFAQRGMVPDAQSTKFRLGEEKKKTPIFCTWTKHGYNERELEASKNGGRDLDTSHIEHGAVLINEAMEDQAIRGLGVNIDGLPAHGLLNSNNTDNHTTFLSKTGDQIVTSLYSQYAIQKAGGFYGPFYWYWAENYAELLGKSFYADGSSKTIQERLQSIQFGGKPLVVKTLPGLPDDYTVLVQMTKNVIQVLWGQDPKPYYEQISRFHTDVYVVACAVTQILYNSDNDTGIVVSTL